MKKFLVFIIILFLIFCGYVIYDNYLKKDEIAILPIEIERANISDISIYGTHLNMRGSFNFNGDIDLVLYNGEFIVYNINSLDNNFNLSEFINDGIYLDDIPIGNYYLFLRVKYMDNDVEKYKYYGLDNSSNYDETEYYTMSNYNKKIVILNEESYPTMMIKVSENINTNVYDIVIDPGHGGMDGGASKYGYKETDFTMDMAIKIKDKLEAYGMKVKLTHEKGQISSNEKLNEYGLHGRAVVSGEVNAKYLFSIHLNGNNSSSVSGLEVYTAKNINYDFAKYLVNNINSITGLEFSNNKINRIHSSIYSRNFTQDNIDSSMKEYKEKDLNAYNITTNSNYYYMIRETGGIITGAYVDDRNDKITANPYVYSNVGTEAYLLELGYITNRKNLDNVINNMDKYVDAIATSIKSLFYINNNVE